MATKWTSPTWRMPEESNQSKFENYSLDFDGSSESIQTSNIASLNNVSKFSISYWFKISDFLSIKRFLGTYSGSTSNWIANLFNSSVGLTFVVRNNDTSKADLEVVSSGKIAVDTWQHISMVYDGSQSGNDNRLKVYLNGTLETLTFTGTIPASTPSNLTGAFNIGSDGYSAQGAKEIGQVAIFDYALSSTQISYLYNSGTPQNPMAISGNAPIAYYPLGGGSTGDAAVSSPSTLTVPNESLPSATVFDYPSGGADWIDIGNSLSLTNAFTLSSWVKTDATPASNIFYKNGTVQVAKDTWYDGGAGNRANITLIDSNGLSKNFRSNVAPAGATVTVGTVVDLKDGEWHQIVFSYDGVNQGKLYTDGALTYTYNITDGAWAGNLASNSNNIYLGGTGSLQSWTGELSNAQIWETVLTEGEVTTLYNNGVPLLSGTQPQAANLKAWYKMNVENSNWLGSDWQIADATSAYPQSFDFNGATGIIPLPQGSLQLVTSISISAWVKTTTTGTRQTIISNDNVSSGGTPPNAGRSWNFLVNGQNINFTLRPENDAAGTIYSNIITSGVNVADNNWHSVVALWDGTTNTNSQKVFVDGILRAQGTPSFTQPMRQYEFNKPTIGDQAGQTQFWDWEGEMSNIQVWESALTYGTVSSLGDAAGGEVAQLYNNGSPLTTAIASSNLKGWYKLNNNEIWDGSNWEVENQAYPASYESALNFDATPALITIPDSSALRFVGTDFSISFWLQPKASGNQIIMDKYGPAVAGWGVYLQSGNLRFLSYLPSNWQTMTTVSQNVWTHILIVGDNTGQNLICYKNGTEVYNAAYALGVISNTTDLIVGTENSSGSLDYVGDLSNLVIWDSNQSSEKDNIYNSGTPANSYTNTPVGWWKLDNVTTGIQDISGSSNGVITGNVTKVNTFVSTEIGVSSGMTESNLVNNNVSTLNGTSSGMTTANLVNSDLTRSIPYSSYSMAFDGAAEDIRCGNSLGSSLSQPEYVTVSCWVYFNNIAEEQGLWNFRSGDNANDVGTSLSLYDSGATLRLAYYEGGNNGYVTISDPGFSNENWYNIVCVYDKGAAGKIYINGQAQTVVDSGVYSTVDFSSDNFYIGSYYSSTYATNGNLSNIAVWNLELTSNQVLTVYNGGAPNDISSLSPIRWWSLSGDSYFDGNNFICPNLTSSSNDGTSHNLGSTDLIGNGPGSTANGIATSMNIPANLQGNAPNSTKNAFSINMAANDKTSSVPDISS